MLVLVGARVCFGFKVSYLFGGKASQLTDYSQLQPCERSERQQASPGRGGPTRGVPGGPDGGGSGRFRCRHRRGQDVRHLASVFCTKSMTKPNKPSNKQGNSKSRIVGTAATVTPSQLKLSRLRIASQVTALVSERCWYQYAAGIFLCGRRSQGAKVRRAHTHERTASPPPLFWAFVWATKASLALICRVASTIMYELVSCQKKSGTGSC